MTIKSMTGYGRGETETEGRLFTVEVRCVNNRYLDAKIKLPRDYGMLEESVRKIVARYHHRGRVDLSLTVTGDFSNLVEVRVNKEVARAYKTSLAELGEVIGVEQELSLNEFAQLPDVLIRQQKGEDLEIIRSFVDDAVKKALESCAEMRAQEAAILVDDLENRLTAFSDLLAEIEQLIPTLLHDREDALRERLDKLLGTVDLDPMRLAQEVAIIADKSDVTEEIVRLRSHISQFRDILTSTGGVGRKLDFLIQEFLREVNTIASKMSNADVAHMTVSLKGELEKMREQIQNIE